VRPTEVLDCDKSVGRERPALVQFCDIALGGQRGAGQAPNCPYAYWHAVTDSGSDKALESLREVREIRS
jgi:hypothetical protein